MIVDCITAVNKLMEEAAVGPTVPENLGPDIILHDADLVTGEVRLRRLRHLCVITFRAVWKMVIIIPLLGIVSV